MQNDYLDYLSHHGIEGQKWGKRNGPPYPLSPEDYSAAEKRLANASKKSDKYSNKSKKLAEKSAKIMKKSSRNQIRGLRKGDSDKQLKAAKLMKKASKLQVKSLKYSKKAENWLKEKMSAEEDIRLSKLEIMKSQPKDVDDILKIKEINPLVGTVFILDNGRAATSLNVKDQISNGRRIVGVNYTIAADNNKDLRKAMNDIEEYGTTKYSGEIILPKGMK